MVGRKLAGLGTLPSTSDSALWSCFLFARSAGGSFCNRLRHRTSIDLSNCTHMVVTGIDLVMSLSVKEGIVDCKWRSMTATTMGTRTRALDDGCRKAAASTNNSSARRMVVTGWTLGRLSRAEEREGIGGSENGGGAYTSSYLTAQRKWPSACEALELVSHSGKVNRSFQYILKRLGEI